MWVRTNVNPGKRRVGDCVIRAISTATGMSWLEVYDDLHRLGRQIYDVTPSNELWGLYLYRMGFEPLVLPENCPSCVTVAEFARRFPRGRYIVGTGSHAVAVIDGDWFDTFDSGELVPSYFFVIDRR